MADPMLMRMSSKLEEMTATLERLEKRLSGSSVESLMADEPVVRKKQSVPRSKKQSGPKPGFAISPEGIANAFGKLKKTGIDPKNASKKVKKSTLPDTPPPPKNGDAKKRRRRSRRN